MNVTDNFEMDFLYTQAQSEAAKANDENAASIVMAQCADCGLFVLFGNLWIAWKPENSHSGNFSVDTKNDGFLTIYVTFKYGYFGYLSDFFWVKHCGFVVNTE